MSIVRRIAAALVIVMLALAWVPVGTHGSNLAAATPYEQAVLADQPIALWRLDESSGTTAADGSQQGHSATLNGAVLLGGAGALVNDTGAAMTFDGQSSYVRDDSPVSVGGDFTIEAWVKAGSTTQNAALVSLFDGHATRTLYLQGQQYRGMTDVSGNWPTYSTVSSSVDPTSWHHVVFTSQSGGTILSLFVDGLQSSRATVPATADFSSNTVLAWSDATWLASFAGSLEHVALYATALPADRVKAHFVASGWPVASECSISLQTRIDLAAAGSVLTLPACVYRETVTVTKPLTLDGQNQAEIRGSDVWAQWSASGSAWVSAQSVPNLGSDSNQAVYLDQFRAANLEQVFLDGVPLAHVPKNPNADQFQLDAARHVVLGTNPAGHTVEVSTRSRWLITAADNVTIENLSFHHAASPSQAGAINNDGHSGWTLQTSVLTDAHGVILGLGSGAPRVLGNVLARGGQLAIGGYQADGAIIRGNTVSSSGSGGWDPSWAGGGIKLAHMKNVTIDSNTVHDDGGPGIWCDIMCDGVVISNNHVFNEPMSPIFYEVSSNAQIFGNSVWNSSGWGGIVISSSGNVDVHNNTLAHTTALRAQLDNRERPNDAGTNVHIYDNQVAEPANNQATSWWQMSPDSNGNTDRNNPSLGGADSKRIADALQVIGEQLPRR